MLWPVEDIPKNNTPGAQAPDNNNAEDNSVQRQPAQGMRQPAAASERDIGQRIVPEATTADGQHRSGLLNWHNNNNNSEITGIRNLGNTCYFNAVLQGLFALVHLREKMLEQEHPAGPLHLELKKLFQLTSSANSAGGVLETENLFSIMSSVKQDFKVGVMEDSNNLLVSMLDGLSNEEPTMVKSLFRGQVAEHVSSKQCEHTSDTTQDLDLSLPIPSKEHVSISIDDCLELYANADITDWHCEACSAAARNTSSSNQEIIVVDEDQNGQSDSNNKEEKEKIYRAANVQHRVSMAPPILTIQLKRFGFVSPCRSDKREEHVKFPEVLDITGLMENRSVDEDYKYCLVAVIVHRGTKLSEGHNFSYVRARSNRQQNGARGSWFCASDLHVEEVSIQEVLSCQAYILFYEKVEQSEARTNPETDPPTNHYGQREIEMAIEMDAPELQPTVESPDVAEKAAEPAEQDQTIRPATAAAQQPDTEMVSQQQAIVAAKELNGSSAVTIEEHGTQLPAASGTSPTLDSSPRSVAPSSSTPPQELH